MKPIFKTMFFLALIASLSGCVVVPVMRPGHSSHAPGQIKKVTGAQSAKHYAPGQRKKH